MDIYEFAIKHPGYTFLIIWVICCCITDVARAFGGKL